MVIQSENDELKKEVMELKAKVLQITREKEDLAKEKNELISQRIVEEPLAIAQPIDTTKLAESMAHVSLKEKEFSQLDQEKNQLEKSNKEKQENITCLKTNSWAKKC